MHATYEDPNCCLARHVLENVIKLIVLCDHDLLSWSHYAPYLVAAANYC